MLSSSPETNHSSLMSKNQIQNHKRRQNIVHFLIHLFCIGVYLLPLLTHSFAISKPVLDEAHIVSSENKDVSGEAVWYEALYNDYWGRPMTSSSSHKSWRPLTIWSFRFLGGDLWVHRVFNVITHAACAELVSTLLTTDYTTSILIKLLFALHPTHVEVTANAANRPHLLACLFAVVLSNPSLHILGVAIFEVMGLMCAETFIFSMPATLLTLTYKHRQAQSNNLSWNDTVTELLPRYTVILLLNFVYIGGRFALDTLSIPDGLIRPAENPFYEFRGMHRIRNYLYVISIHVAKSLNLDFIGFSHEYGTDCIPALNSWSDVRLLIPVGMILAVATMCVYIVIAKRQYTLLLLVHLSWLATLFPISGIIKVGTFVADRIVVASTVSTSIWIGTILSYWFQRRGGKVIKGACIAALLIIMWYRVHVRSLQWMDSLPLLQSSLKTCPRSAKSHLEMSKVHSGLYPDEFNLTNSLLHLKQVQQIDPNMCDVHQQFAHVYIQQQEYLLMEEHLVQGVLCPFSMGGSVELWRRYWQLAGQDPEAQKRMEQYNKVIQRAIEEEQRREALKTHEQQGRYGGGEL